MNDLTEITGLRRYPLARRGFVMTGLMTGFSLATTVVEAQAIHTDAANLDAGEVKIPVKDGQLPAYYARPAQGGKECRMVMPVELTDAPVERAEFLGERVEITYFRYGTETLDLVVVHDGDKPFQVEVLGELHRLPV